jgi:MYXO-CTERM domain-containing protein
MKKIQTTALAVILLAGTTAGAFAQATTTTPSTGDNAGTRTERVADTDDDDGFDIGWLGLIGLLGLAGLRRPKHVTPVDTTTRNRV